MIQTGLWFEEMALEHLESFKGYKHSTRVQDVYTGADFYMDGIPVDITLNYSNKKGKLQNAGKLCIDKLFELQIGVRYTNSRTELTTPVLVIGFNVVQATDALWEIKQLDEDVFETIFDLYWNTIDSLI